MPISTKCRRVMGYIAFLAATGCGLWGTAVLAAGLMPVPVLKDAQIRAGVGFDATTGRYTYTYTINNPANQNNTGKIWSMSLDTTHMGNVRWMDSAGLTLPKGFATKTFDEQLDATQPLDLPFGTTVIPFGLQVPVDWVGGFGKNGHADFSGPPGIIPGSSLGGFKLISPGLPAIRAAMLEPWWVHLVPDAEDVSEEEEAAGAAVEEQIRFHTVTLGPSGVFPGTYDAPRRPQQGHPTGLGAGSDVCRHPGQSVGLRPPGGGCRRRHAGQAAPANPFGHAGRNPHLPSAARRPATWCTGTPRR